MVEQHNLRLFRVTWICSYKYVTWMGITMYKPMVKNHLAKYVNEYVRSLHRSILTKLLLNSFKLVYFVASYIFHHYASFAAFPDVSLRHV